LPASRTEPRSWPRRPHSENKWFLFDDEAVSAIHDLNGPDLYNEEGERVEIKKKGKEKKPGAGFIRADDGSMYVSRYLRSSVYL
jgi:hypothetical protein